MAIYLVSYHPLAEKRQGVRIAEKFGLPPYIDNSIRLEPDFQSLYPSISALCRTDKFAPKLYEGDVAIYITVKADYDSIGYRHWRLVGILKVKCRFETHESAADWYSQQNIPLPSNCMVKGNPPKPHNLIVPRKRHHHNPKLWDGMYRKRARNNSTFLACEALYLELFSPPIIQEIDYIDVFGRIPGTRNPPKITEQQYKNLIDQVDISL